MSKKEGKGKEREKEGISNWILAICSVVSY